MVIDHGNIVYAASEPGGDVTVYFDVFQQQLNTHKLTSIRYLTLKRYFQSSEVDSSGA